MTEPEESAGPRARRLSAALVLAAVVYVALIPREQLLTFDPTYYLGLAVSLVGGDGYTFLGVPHTTYPPGLPAMFAPLVAIAGPSVNAAQILIALWAPVVVLAVLAYTRIELPRHTVWLTTVACGSIGFFLLATEQLRSELPYLAVVAWAVVLALRAPEGSGRARPGALVLVAALSAAAVLSRTIGIALPLAMLCAWVQRRARRCPHGAHDALLLAGTLGGLAAAAGWFAWTGAHGSNGYVNYLLLKDPHDPDLGRVQVAELVPRIAEALVVQLAHVGELLTGVPWLLPTWLSPFSALIAALLVVGLVIELRRERSVVAWYVMGYGGILLLWPFDEGPRFVVPAIVFVLVLMFRGGAQLARMLVEPDRDSLAQTSPGTRPVRVRRGVAITIAASGLTCAVLAVARVGDFPLASTQGLGMAAIWGLIGVAGGVLLVYPSAATYVALRGRAILAAYLVAFGLLHGAQIVPKAIANVRGLDTSVHAAMRPGIEWLCAHAEPGSVVIGQFDSTIHFYTGLMAVALPATRDAERLEAVFVRANPRYVVVNDTPEFPYMLPTEEERFEDLREQVGAERFEVAYRFPAGTVYLVR
jgi:hypothetical protein